MKKLAYLFMFIFASASLTSCGASSQSCATTETIIVKNSKFENYEMVVSSEKIISSEEVASIKASKTIDYIATNDDME